MAASLPICLNAATAFPRTSLFGSSKAVSKAAMAASLPICPNAIAVLNRTWLFGSSRAVSKPGMAASLWLIAQHLILRCAGISESLIHPTVID